LDSAFAQCIKHAVDYLVRKHGLTPEEAYMLCSVVVDFKILEAVDKPNYLVGGHIPKRIFGPKK
jgi:acetamidase/formamidase